MSFGCPLLPTGKLQRQRFGKSRKRIFYFKATESGRMAGPCLRAHPLRETQRKPSHPLPDLVVLRVPSPIQNTALWELQGSSGDHPSSSASFRHCQAPSSFLEFACGARATKLLIQLLPTPGPWGHCQLLRLAIQGLRRVPTIQPCGFQGPPTTKHLSARPCWLVPGEERLVSPFPPFRSLLQNFRLLLDHPAPPTNPVLFPG